MSETDLWDGHGDVLNAVVGRSKDNDQTPQYLRQFQRRKIAYELRLKGMSYKEISLYMKENHPDIVKDEYYPSTVEDDVKDLLYRLIKDTQDSLPQFRAGELFKLSLLEEALWDDAKAGNTRAVTAVLKIMDRRAAITGIDAPKKTINIQIDAIEEAKNYARQNRLSEVETEALISRVKAIATSGSSV